MSLPAAQNERCQSNVAYAGVSLLGCEVSLQQADGAKSVGLVLAQRLDGACQLGSSSSVAVEEHHMESVGGKGALCRWMDTRDRTILHNFFG